MTRLNPVVIPHYDNGSCSQDPLTVQYGDIMIYGNCSCSQDPLTVQYGDIMIYGNCSCSQDPLTVQYGDIMIYGNCSCSQDPLTVQYGDIMIYGERRTLPQSRTGLYEVRVSTTNDSHAFAGLYLCVFERPHEKMYAVSSIQFAGAMSPTHEAPTASIKSCAGDNYDSSDKVGDMTLVLPQYMTMLSRCINVWDNLSGERHPSKFTNTGDLFTRYTIWVRYECSLWAKLYTYIHHDTGCRLAVH